VNESITENCANTVIENIKTRWSCRVFREESIPRNDIEKLIDAANFAPSPMNTQPWEFIVLTGEPLSRFREAVAEWLHTPRKKENDETVVLSETGQYTSFPAHLAARKKEHLQWTAKRVEKLGLKLKEIYPVTFFCHNAPVVIMVIGDAVRRDRHGLEIHQGLAAAIQNILLAAHSMGYGTCWVGDIMRFGKRLNEHLGLDNMKEVVGAVALGHPDAESAVNRDRALKRPPKVDWRGC
jgi:nitroreductase